MGIIDTKLGGLLPIKRCVRHLFQWIFCGITDAETWSLDYIIGRFAYPRIKLFRKLCIGCPSEISQEKWDYILGEIEWFFGLHAKGIWGIGAVDEKRYEEAGKLLGKYFGNLWW